MATGNRPLTDGGASVPRRKPDIAKSTLKLTPAQRRPYRGTARRVKPTNARPS